MNVRVNVTGLGPSLSAVIYSARIDYAKGRLGYRLPSVVPQSQMMRAIAAAVAQAYGITVADLRGQCRARHFAWPRQETMWRMRQVLNEEGRHRYSLPQIGAFLGGRDHSTVLHGVRAFEKRQEAAKRADEQAWVDFGRWAAE